MALTNSSGSNNGKVFYLRPVSRDKDKKDVPPHFLVTTRENGNYIQLADTPNTIKGDLIGISHKEKEFQGIKTDEIVLTFTDPVQHELYRLDLRLNMSTRSLLNAVLGLEEFDNLEINYYRSKKGYDQFSLTQDGEKVSWRYNLEDVPKPTVVKLRGVDTKDYYDVDKWYLGKLSEFSNKHNLGPKSRAESTEAPDSEIPF